MPWKQRMVAWLDRRTQANRQRSAAAMFMLGADRPRPWDGLVTRIDFALSAGVWATKAADREHVLPLAAALERLPEPAAVLDIGTGAGGSAALIADRFPSTTVEAIDSSARMLAAARNRSARPNVTYTRASVAHMPFPDGTFDLVVMLNALPELVELRRVTAAGAHVISAFSFSAPRSTELDILALARWAQMGFTRVESGTAGQGWWEWYTRESSRGPNRT